MAKKSEQKKAIESYEHKGKKRANNPPVGLVTPETDAETGKKKRYKYDPHIDPALQWAGKAERTSFEVPTISLHVHERIDPRTIIEAVKTGYDEDDGQGALFEQERQIPLRQAIEFYRHSNDWTNRLIAGDSLLVMNSLLQKENMAGKVQCVYMDPPYGIKYGSNFQPFVGKKDVKDGKDEDLTAEPEMIKAFRDTWELGIHSYLSYMRDRLLLARELLTDSGSVFVQISDQNVHHVREIMDEVFGAENFISLINYATTSGLGNKYLETTGDYLIWYGRDIEKTKNRTMWLEKSMAPDNAYRHIELKDGTRRAMTKEEKEGRKPLPSGCRIFSYSDLRSQSGGEKGRFPIELEGKVFRITNGSWKTNESGIKNLIAKKRLGIIGKNIRYVRYIDDFSCKRLTNMWTDTGIAGYASNKTYVVETSTKVIQRCLLMTTDPGDLVFDPTCGSGATAYIAEQWGRRWVTCDTSRVALALARQRLMTASFDYYKLKYPEEGVGSGFDYQKVPHITLKSIANDDPPLMETLFDQPFKEKKKSRVTGPFTVEAVPAPTVRPINGGGEAPALPADSSVARSGETLRQHEWRAELLKTGIRCKGKQRIAFSRVEPLPCRWLHAEAETKPNENAGANEAKEPAPTAYRPQRAVISFGPENAPLEQRQVENALQEAATMRPKPKIIVFAAFQFDPEAAKDIDETNWPGMTLLKVQMNADMQTEDLKKKRASNESFWLVGQPEVHIEQVRSGHLLGQWFVEVRGFDYFNTRNGEITSGEEKNIAVWMLDTDYDGRCLYPRQVFFPLAGDNEGWMKLAKSLKAEIDEGLMEVYRGTMSLPFKLGKNRRIAVKIVDDRGIESLRVLEMPGNE